MDSTALAAARADTGTRWLDLVATRANWPSRVPLERLPDLDALSSWLDDHALAPEAAPIAADLNAVRQIRAALRELAAARVEGRTPHPSAFDTVNAALARAAKAPRHIVVPDPIEPGYVRRRVPDVDAALTLMIEQAIDTMSSTEAGYLRECEEASCRELFLDSTGRRRWCSTPACGIRARVRAHRARLRESSSG
ncbi:MAG TPA: CGNR zinc finger domain-containing protein [Acidothermaceae bacterium]|jgi:predicted RNA-binding Zn ribbon-like protein